MAVDAHSGRYTGFIINFALGFHTSQLEMFKWLLWPIDTADVAELERGLKYGDPRSALNERHPAAPINAGNITQAPQSVASLRVGKMEIKPINLDYDEINRRLSVVDRTDRMGAMTRSAVIGRRCWGLLAALRRRSVRSGGAAQQAGGAAAAAGAAVDAVAAVAAVAV